MRGHNQQRSEVMKKIFIAWFCLVIVIIASGCETVKGLGRDIENTGQNIQEVFNKGE
jgi:predicted small secreted protein